MAFGTSLDTGLDSYYSFDIDTRDDSGNGWDLGPGGGSPQPVQVTGLISNGYYFNGGDFDADPALLRTEVLSSWTFSTWIFHNSGTPFDGHDFLLFGSVGDTSLFYGTPAMRNDSFEDVYYTGPISDDVWNHIVFSFDDTTKDYYMVVNGDWLNRASGTLSNAFGMWPMWYGVGYDGHIEDCILDEMGLWNRMLTQTEVEALYNSGAGLSYFGGPAAVATSSICGHQFLVTEPLVIPEPTVRTSTCGHRFLVSSAGAFGQRLILDLARAAKRKISKPL